MEEVAGGFLMKKNKFLFAKRSKKKAWAPGKWDIAGGNALPNEDVVKTLEREVKEELTIRVVTSELLTSIIVPATIETDCFRYHIYLITCWKGKPSNNSKEHSKIRWFTLKKLRKRKLAMPLYLELIDKFKRNSAG